MEIQYWLMSAGSISSSLAGSVVRLIEPTPDLRPGLVQFKDTQGKEEEGKLG